MLFISSTRIISFRQQRQPGNGNVEVEGKKILIMNIINKMLKLVTTKRFSCDNNRAVTINLIIQQTTDNRQQATKFLQSNIFKFLKQAQLMVLLNSILARQYKLGSNNVKFKSY